MVVDPTDIEGHTPLFLALRGGHSETAGMLVKACASFDVISKVCWVVGNPFFLVLCSI